MGIPFHTASDSLGMETSFSGHTGRGDWWYGQGTLNFFVKTSPFCILYFHVTSLVSKLIPSNNIYHVQCVAEYIYIGNCMETSSLWECHNGSLTIHFVSNVCRKTNEVLYQLPSWCTAHIACQWQPTQQVFSRQLNICIQN